MSRFVTLVARDLRIAFAGGGAMLPLAFFLLVATFFPFAIGPDKALLAKAGTGILWTAALLAALLPVERLFAPDLADGTLDQLAVRGIGEEMVAVARIVAHWLGFGPPLMLAALPAAGLLGLDPAALGRLEAGPALGTPGLAALAVATAALTAGLRGGGGAALAGLVMLPPGLPLLIFGAGSAAGGAGALKLLAAASLLLLAGTPFVAAAALRAART